LMDWKSVLTDLHVDGTPFYFVGPIIARMYVLR